MKILVSSFVFFCLPAWVLAQKTTNNVRSIKPLIGTQKLGHTNRGATEPFGSVQLSPDIGEHPHNIGGKIVFEMSDCNLTRCSRGSFRFLNETSSRIVRV